MAKEPLKVGRYSLYEPIAQGGTATVHVGRLRGPVGFSRTVAVKRLLPWLVSDPELLSMLLDEARLAARIRHPNVVPIIDVVTTAEELFLVMEYIPGESLAVVLQEGTLQRKRMPLPIVSAVVSGALRGLHAAHEATDESGRSLQIVHRDVSPQNVLVGVDGLSRVIDFGIAKAVGRAQTTREGQLKGKRRYMAPEQLLGKPVTPRTDVFAASVMLWEMLTAKPLFSGVEDSLIGLEVLGRDVIAPSKAGGADRPGEKVSTSAIAALDEVVRVGADKDPARRYASAKEMALALEACVPPASLAEVADWVQSTASRVLARHASLVAQAEQAEAALEASVSPEDATRPGGALQSGAPSAAPDEQPTTVYEPSSESSHRKGAQMRDLARSSERPLGPTPDPAPAPPSAPDPDLLRKVRRSDVRPTQRGVIAARGTRRWVMAGIGAATMLAIVWLVMAYDRKPVVTARPVPPSGSIPPSSRRATDEPPAGDGFNRSPAASASASTAGMSTGAPSTTNKHAPARSPCSPPFTYDREGTKHYKPECM